VFDHTHYVPILRWKMGEKGALRELRPKDRAKLTPLIEWSRPNEVAAHGESLATAETPQDLARDIIKHWGARPFFCDVHTLLDGHLGGQLDALRRVAMGLRDGGTRPIPVLWLDDGPAYVSTLECLSSGAGACLRLREDDVSRSGLQSRIEGLLSSIGVTTQHVDLVVDLAADVTGMDVGVICPALPRLGSWRTFTVVAGSFPPDLKAFQGPGRYYQPRAEWLVWKAQSSRRLPRLPTFGDYATLHPVLTTYKPGLNPSASIRYATDESWMIMRGEGLRNEDGPGHAQYPANAALLMRRPEYCGPSFSYGDKYISEVGAGRTGTGNPTTWVRAGVNHHLTFAVRQIASLFGAADARRSWRVAARGQGKRRRAHTAPALASAIPSPERRAPPGVPGPRSARATSPAPQDRRAD